MRAYVTTVHDPFHPDRGRELRAVERAATIGELAPVTSKPFICIRNGQPLMRRDWGQRVADGEIIAFVTLPAGGGGGGSNPLKLLLTIAVMAFAYYAVGFASLAAGGVIQPLTAQIVYGVAVMAGTALVNALIPPPKPATGSNFSSAGLPAASPTYNLQAQGNMARLEAPIPDHYGRLKFYPDFAAQPYAEFSGNEQYLYQLMVVGQGYYSIESINIDDTPLDSWDDISYEVIEPGDTLSMFPGNVATSGEVGGQELIYNTASGPFVASAPGTTTNFLGLDVVFPQGLYYFDTNGNVNAQTVTFRFEACQVDDSGNEVGSYFTLGNESVTAATTTPKRFSYRYPVGALRYTVKATRTSTKPTGTGYQTTILWAGLRAYMPDVANYGEVTLIAMRLRASNQLSIQSSRKINVVATRKLNTWDPATGWGDRVATRSPAWAIANMLRATYGADLGDERYDLEGLHTLSQIWEARGDNFDMRFDTAGTLWDSVCQAAAVGRARPYVQGGVIYVKRDAEQTIPVALFSMRNIVKGSLSVEYMLANENTADAVEVTYYSDVSWMPQRVIGKLEGSSALKPAKLSMIGITGKDQAIREATYNAAANYYRREVIRFNTEMEGFIPTYGDLIAIQHDMPAWGQHAEVLEWDQGTLTMTLSEPMTFGSGTHYIGLRRKDGGIEGPIVVTAGATAYELVLAETPPFTPYTGREYERTYVTFGWAETWRKRALVVSIRPRGTEVVEIEAVSEDPSVHTADEGVTAPPVSYSQLPTLYTAPVVAGLIATNSPDEITTVMMSWEQAAGADYYIVEQSVDEVEWARVAETRANNVVFTALFGSATVIRVAAVGLTRGPWVTLHYGSVADYMWDAVDTTLMWDADSGVLMWR